MAKTEYSPMDSLPPEFGVLLVGKVKSDLTGLALSHHVENLPVLGHVYPTGALGELDQRFIVAKSGSARQRGAHPVSVGRIMPLRIGRR